jgi:hypothetical protein
MACKRSSVRLRYSPPNKIKASEQSGALLFLAGSNMVQTVHRNLKITDKSKWLVDFSAETEGAFKCG